jgi:choline dehydrogenase
LLFSSLALNPESAHYLTARREVILSAGAINSPHILLHSGIGDEAELKKLGIALMHSLPSVGKNMTDQPYVSVVWNVSSTAPPYVL